MSQTAQSTPLFGWDLAAWRLSQADPALRSTVVGIVKIEGRLDGELLRQRVQLAVDNHRVLRCVVAEGGAGPSLVEVAGLDASSRISFAEGSDVAAHAHSYVETVFDHQLPLWRLGVIYTSTHTYVIAALHHAIADGNGALALAGYLFDQAQSGAEQSEGVRPSKVDATHQSLRVALVRVFERAVRDPQGLARDLSTITKSLNSVLQVPQDVHAQAMAQRSSSFGQLFFRFPKSAVRQATLGKGVSQHDALVAAMCRAVWLYHSEQDLTLERVRINVPVALNVERAAANQMIVARIEMDLTNPRPDALMQQSNERLHEWRNQPALAVASELVEASRLIPTAVLASVVKKADATISSLRGVPRLGTVGGHQVSGIWPLVAPIGAAVSVTSVGVGLDVSMCVTHDTAAVRDESLWTRCLSQAMSETAGVTLVAYHFD